MSSPFLPQPILPATRRSPPRSEAGAATRRIESAGPHPAGLFPHHRTATRAAAGLRAWPVLAHCTEVAARRGGGRARTTGCAPTPTDVTAG